VAKFTALLGEILDLGILLGQFSLEVGNTLLQLIVLSLEFGGRELDGGFALDKVDGGGGDLLDESGGEGAELGGSVGASSPFSGGEGGLVGGSLGEKILLEDVGLTRNSEGDGLNGGGHGLVESHDFVGAYVDSTLGHSGHTLLRNVGTILRQEVDNLVVINNFKVADGTISLSGQEQDGGSVVVEGHDDTGGLVNAFSLEGLLQVLGIPDGEGTLGGLGETNGEELVLVT